VTSVREPSAERKTRFGAGPQQNQIPPAQPGKCRFNALTGHRIGTFPRDPTASAIVLTLAASDGECYSLARAAFQVRNPGVRPCLSVTANRNVREVPATELRCCECGGRFNGRSDACYCSGACRQKAYRARVAHEGDDPDLSQSGDAAQVARQLRKRSRLTRKKAAATMRKSAALRNSRKQ
jgi:hypothetical protein